MPALLSKHVRPSPCKLTCPTAPERRIHPAGYDNSERLRLHSNPQLHRTFCGMNAALRGCGRPHSVPSTNHTLRGINTAVLSLRSKNRKSIRHEPDALVNLV